MKKLLLILAIGSLFSCEQLEEIGKGNDYQSPGKFYVKFENKSTIDKTMLIDVYSSPSQKSTLKTPILTAFPATGVFERTFEIQGVMYAYAYRKKGDGDFMARFTLNKDGLTMGSENAGKLKAWAIYDPFYKKP